MSVSHFRRTDALHGAAPRVVDDPVDASVALERARLYAEAGLDDHGPAHFRRPVERPFTAQERGNVTVLTGGLSPRHDALLKAVFEQIGFRTDLVPVPTKADFQAGREFGNNGQCNPTYFTVGALVNYLRRLRDDEQVPTRTILDEYVFITAGACGPCRFGMYEAEFRLALRNAGFDGFRVITFAQKPAEIEGEPGFEANLEFYLAFINMVMLGDLVNEVAYQVRPYEVNPGETNAVVDAIVADLQVRMRTKNPKAIRAGRLSKLFARVLPVRNADDLAKVVDQLRSEHFAEGLRAGAARLDEIEVDFLRVRPIVKITGEFWAQTTDGDGNFNMFPFLEAQGAEVLVEPITTWVNYLVSQAGFAARDRRGLAAQGVPAGLTRFAARAKDEAAYRKTQLLLAFLGRVVGREYERLRLALGGTAHAQLDQLELQRMAHPYYNSRSGGGEGHLEVAKNIYYSMHHVAHMVMSLKPFGCMPSTQSDGAQAAVVSHFPDMIYLPIETSGEGDVNAHSRVQMALGEAKVKAREEFAAAVAKSGYPLAQIKAYVAARRELRRPLLAVPHHHGVVGRAANFALYVGGLMKRDGIVPDAAPATATATERA